MQPPLAPTRPVRHGPGLVAADRPTGRHESLAVIPAVLAFLPLVWAVLAAGSFGLALAFGPFPPLVAEVASFWYSRAWLLVPVAPVLAVAALWVGAWWRRGTVPGAPGWRLVRVGSVCAVVALALWALAVVAVILIASALAGN